MTRLSRYLAKVRARLLMEATLSLEQRIQMERDELRQRRLQDADGFGWFDVEWYSLPEHHRFAASVYPQEAGGIPRTVWH